VTDDGIWDIPWCRYYHSEGLRLKALEDFNIGGGGCAPQLDAVCPDSFDGCLINKVVRIFGEPCIFISFTI
jgi:hypothetical protein